MAEENDSQQPVTILEWVLRDLIRLFACQNRSKIKSGGASWGTSIAAERIESYDKSQDAS